MSNQKPLDELTFRRVRRCLDDARRGGHDPVELMHARGLLASPQQQHDVRLEALKRVHREIASWRPAEFLRRKFPANRQTTPTDMYSCILEFVEELIHNEKEA